MIKTDLEISTNNTNVSHGAIKFSFHWIPERIRLKIQSTKKEVMMVAIKTDLTKD